MKKLVVCIIILLITVCLTIGAYFYKDIKSLHITDVKSTYKENKIFITATINPKYNKKIFCIIKESSIEPTKDDQGWLEAKNNCKFEVENKKIYYIFLKNNYNIVSKSYQTYIDINKNLKLNVSDKQLYLAIKGTHILTTKVETFGKPDNVLEWISNNPSIATVKNGKVTGIKKGQTQIVVKTSDGLEEKVNVIVTDLITIPTLNTRKSPLPCNRYTKEEAILLDKILKDRIDKAGYKTRAGVVAAIRFLTLEFPYRIEYFFENGRLNNKTGGAYVDGEGRYYHIGLYLDGSKFKNIKASMSGPSIWGCSLTNWQDKYEEWGYIRGKSWRNGLDCSGFVSWAFYNAGFDVKDTGAGYNYNTDDISDLGYNTPITYSLMTSKKVKAGDVIAKDGHTALVLGIDDTKIYVAESTVDGLGVNISTWTLKGTILSTYLLNYVILLDDFYKKNGNYTRMW